MKLTFTILAAFLATAAFGQKKYDLSVGQETYFPLQMPNYLSIPGWDNDPIEYVQIGFNFEFHGKNYSQFHLSPNGNIYFSDDPFAQVIDPFGTDLYDNPADADTAFILTSLIGTAGNQVRVIEWRKARFKNGEAGDVANFQIRLHQSGTISFVYGDIVTSANSFNGGTGPFCGVWDSPKSTYLFLHQDPAAPSEKRTYSLPFPQLNGVPTSGTRYSFTQVINSLGQVQVTPIEVYPNPATSDVFIATEGNEVSKLELIGLDGKSIVPNYNADADRVKIDLTGLKPGVYILKMEDKTGIRTAKLQVKS